MRPLMLYDGTCGFCKRWIERFRRMTGDRVEYTASQEVGSRYPQILEKQFEESVWLIEPDGKTSGGAEAVFRALVTSCRYPFFFIFFSTKSRTSFGFTKRTMPEANAKSHHSPRRRPMKS